MENNGLICGHKLLGYLLLPFRLLMTLPFLFLAIIFIFLYSLGILPKKIAYFIAKRWIIATNTIFGINIHIKNDIQYEKYKALSKDEKYVVVYNHINPLDILILPNILDNYISFIALGKVVKMFPISYLSKFLEVIKIDKSKRSNTTEKINDFINNSKHKLCIAPDRCSHFEEDEYIAPFKTGAFANKNNVLPIVIRYVPSYKSEDFNWNNPKNEDIGLLTYMRNLLVDGNIDIHIKFLDLQKYDEKKFKDAQEYSEDVREKMKRELKILPKQNSSALSSTKPTNENCVYFITAIALMITMVSISFSDFETGFCMISIAFSGFLYHSFPTNSTLLFDRILVYYSVFKLITYNNSHIINLIKCSAVIFSSIRCIINNYEEQISSADGGRSPEYWVKQHLYSVQLPTLLAALIMILDRNLVVLKNTV